MQWLGDYESLPAIVYLPGIGIGDAFMFLYVFDAYRLEDTALAKAAWLADEEMVRQSVSLFSSNQMIAFTRGNTSGSSTVRASVIQLALLPLCSADAVSAIIIGLLFARAVISL